MSWGLVGLLLPGGGVGELGVVTGTADMMLITRVMEEVRSWEVKEVW